MSVTTVTHSGRLEPGDAPPPKRERRRYVSPVLVEYGAVAKLTQTGGGTSIDFMGMMSMACL